MTISHGDSASTTHMVTDADTAIALGSGDMDVLGTPRLLAWCEKATCDALNLDSDSTSVGTRLQIDHLAASAVGERLRATATVKHLDGRLVKFEVIAIDGTDQLVAHGEIQRVIVNRERFMSRFKS